MGERGKWKVTLIESKYRFPLHQPLIEAGILDPYTVAYPDKMKTKVKISLKNGQTLIREQGDYHVFLPVRLRGMIRLKNFGGSATILFPQRRRTN